MEQFWTDEDEQCFKEIIEAYKHNELLDVVDIKWLVKLVKIVHPNFSEEDHDLGEILKEK